MYVAITGSGKARVIQFREDKRIPGTSKKKTRVIQTIGNYKKKICEDPDIIEKLKAKARELIFEKKQSSAPLCVNLESIDIDKASDTVPFFKFGQSPQTIMESYVTR